MRAAVEKIESLRKALHEHNHRYYMLDQPIITDYEFDQMLKETGLPPIWNGKTLVPWKDYHKNSIEFASQCHSQLGINQPQQQLKGTYAKPVWDPNSSIWRQGD